MSGRAPARTARGLALVCLVSLAAITPAPLRCATTSSSCARKASHGCFNGPDFRVFDARVAARYHFSQPVLVLVDRIAIGPACSQRLVDTVEILLFARLVK